jgi:hypothetical protein
MTPEGPTQGDFQRDHRAKRLQLTRKGGFPMPRSHPTIIDHDPCLEAAIQMRWQAIGALVAGTASVAAPLGRVATRDVLFFVIGFVVATATFWTTMMVSPSPTEAGSPPVVKASASTSGPLVRR